MNFVGKIVVYRFVVGRGATVVSGLGFVSLFWVLEMARVLVYGVEAFGWFWGCCGEVWNLKVGFVLTCVGRGEDMVEGCGRG